MKATSDGPPHTHATPLPDATDRSRLPSIIWFFGSASLLGLAWFLSVGEQRQVLVPWIKVPLPELCTFRRQLSIDCPGCGLTRSFIYLAHGNFTSAWKLNWVGVIIFGYTIAQLPLALLHWTGLPARTGASGKVSRRLVVLNQRLLIGLAALLFIRWLSLWITGDIFD